jgi:hypothetical protein
MAPIWFELVSFGHGLVMFWSAFFLSYEWGKSSNCHE